MVTTIRLVVKMQYTSLLAADDIPDLTKLAPGLPGHVLQHAAGDLDVLGGDVGAALHEDLIVVLLSRHLGQGWRTLTFSGPGIKFMFTNTI